MDTSAVPYEACDGDIPYRHFRDVFPARNGPMAPLSSGGSTRSSVEASAQVCNDLPRAPRAASHCRNGLAYCRRLKRRNILRYVSAKEQLRLATLIFGRSQAVDSKRDFGDVAFPSIMTRHLLPCIVGLDVQTKIAVPNSP